LTWYLLKYDLFLTTLTNPMMLKLIDPPDEKDER
jgi:hypothetical protein